MGKCCEWEGKCRESEHFSQHFSATEQHTFHSNQYIFWTFPPANYVGYITDNITKANFNAIGVSFTSVDGTSGIQLKDLVGTGIFGTDDPFTADQIRIWDPMTSGYEMWYYYVDDSHEWDGWYDLDTQSVLFEDVHPEGLANGSAVWYLSANGSNGGTATMAGAVDTASSVTLTLTRGNFNQVANPFPVGFQLNNGDQVSWENAFGTDDPFTADQIRIWDPATSGYEMWYLYVDDSHEWDGWYDLDTQSILFEEAHPNGLAAGVPCWYLSAAPVGGTFDVTFKTPM